VYDVEREVTCEKDVGREVTSVYDGGREVICERNVGRDRWPMCMI
jgi:hypothetical protein